MKKFTLLVLFSTFVFANDGFFVGLDSSMTKATFEGKNYTNKQDLSQRYDVSKDYKNAGFGFIVGYKLFFNDYLGLMGILIIIYLARSMPPSNPQPRGWKYPCGIMILTQTLF